MYLLNVENLSGVREAQGREAVRYLVPAEGAGPVRPLRQVGWRACPGLSLSDQCLAHQSVKAQLSKQLSILLLSWQLGSYAADKAAGSPRSCRRQLRISWLSLTAENTSAAFGSWEYLSCT